MNLLQTSSDRSVGHQHKHGHVEDVDVCHKLDVAVSGGLGLVEGVDVGGKTSNQSLVVLFGGQGPNVAILYEFSRT